MSEAVKDYPPYLDYPKPRMKQTNADKIRAMTDEELAMLLNPTCPPQECPDHLPFDQAHDCYKCWLDWLQQEIPAQPQKDPLCLSCAHANISVTDDFADCLCAKSGGYEGGKTECKDYAPMEVSDNGCDH